MDTNPLIRAINIVGGQKPLAEAIGTTQSQVWYWLNRSKRGVPGEMAPKIEEATNGAVKRHELRPDIFAAPAVSETAA